MLKIPIVRLRTHKRKRVIVVRTSQTSIHSYQSESNKQPHLLFNVDLNKEIKTAVIQNYPTKKPPLKGSKQKLESTEVSGVFIGVSERALQAV